MRFTSGQKSGFTLLETLIAFSVFSLFIIAVHKSFVFGLKGQESADWSNTIGQTVRSEFALIEVGLAQGRTYRKNFDQDYRLEVEISGLSLDQVVVPISGFGLFLATINVRNLKEGSSQEFRKVVSLRSD